jgi:hypothetical protein
MPCTPVCASTSPNLTTAPDACTSSASVNASALLVASSLGKSADVTLSPGGALRQGVRTVKVTAKYGKLSVKTTCTVNVMDQQAPKLTLAPPSGSLCAYPKKGSTSACFSIRKLAVLADNCRPKPTLLLRNCTVTANGASTDCFQDSSKRVCVRYNSGTTPLTAQAVFTARDASGNESPATTVTITAYGVQPNPVPPGCQPN